MRGLLVCLVVAWTVPAHAESSVPKKARMLATEGQRAHAAGQYVRAIDAFERAYVLAPSSALMFNLAQAYRLSGDCENALIMYRRFLEAGPSVESATVAGVHMRAMERCVHPPVQASVVATAPGRYLLAPPSSALVVKKTSTKSSSPSKLGTALAIGGVAALGVAIAYRDDGMMAAGFGVTGAMALGGAVVAWSF